MKTVLCAIILAAVSTVGVASTTTVNVEQGSLKGIREDGLTVFRGVPFAAPPVGDLRWRPPQPPAKWQGVRPAANFAPQCVQNIGSGARQASGHERGLSLPQRVDSGEVRTGPYPGAGLDLRRRL